MKKKRSFTISMCVCPTCENKFPIPRTKKAREKGHIKTIWCPFCKEDKDMLEVREFDTYKNNLGEILE